MFVTVDILPALVSIGKFHGFCNEYGFDDEGLEEEMEEEDPDENTMIDFDRDDDENMLFPLSDEFKEADEADQKQEMMRILQDIYQNRATFSVSDEMPANSTSNNDSYQQNHARVPSMLKSDTKKLPINLYIPDKSVKKVHDEVYSKQLSDMKKILSEPGIYTNIRISSSDFLGN